MINAGRGQYQRTLKAGLRERERGESLVADTATSWHQLVATRFSARLGLARHSGHSDDAYYHRHACDAGHCGDRRLRRCGLAPQQYLVDGRCSGAAKLNGQHAVVAEHYSTTTPRAKAELPSIQHSGSRGD